MPTYTKFDGLSLEMEKKDGFLVVRLMVPRGAGLRKQKLDEASISINHLLEPS